MNTVSCLVVDDEPLARKIVETYISAVPGWQIVRSCINAAEAFDALQEAHIDVMFLDIHMPVISGVDFLRSLPHPPLVVFTTAYSEHATTGFDLNAVDYLVKPITSQRFRQAVEKITGRLREQDRRTAQPPVDYVFIRQDAKLVRINYGDVLFAEARRDFTFIHLRGKKLLVGMHLKALESIFSPQRMLRVHRSYIINLDAVTAIDGNRIDTAGGEVPIGANYKPELLRRLGL